MKPIVKQTLMWVVVIACALLLYLYVGNSGPKVLTPSYSEVMTKVQAGQVKDVTIEGGTMAGHFADGEQFRTAIPGHQPAMFTTLRDHRVNVTVRDESSSGLVNALLSAVPFALMALPLVVLAVSLTLFRRSRSGRPTDA